MSSTYAMVRGHDPSDPIADPARFFKSARRALLATLETAATDEDAVARVTARAFELFEWAVADESVEGAGLACHGGCASCCTIRVVATAPEVLAVAQYIRGLPGAQEALLTRRIADADRSTRRHDEAQRFEAGVRCPFVEDGLCVVYDVRPLACRGHASFDAQACVDVLTGQSCEVPVSMRHLTVRSLVQNALQSALRAHGRAWGVYELNQASRIAMSDDTCAALWTAGGDSFAPAEICEISREEMAATFDAIEALET